MLALIQRVTRASVTVESGRVSQIGPGLVILIGISEEDGEKEVLKLTEKIVHLRIMSDENGKMNRSILETKGEVLFVSQFTLVADLKYGRRPSFIKAKNPTEAKKLYELFAEKLNSYGISVKRGKFGEYMEVEIINDGPVTIVMQSENL